MEQLLKESFEYSEAAIKISKERISGEILDGELLRGDFRIENSIGKKMRGFLYSTNARVGYVPEAFHGCEVKIVYEVDTTGLKSGAEIVGEFVICSNIGEYHIPYFFCIKARRETTTSSEQIEDLAAFVNLAKTDFQKAYVLFLTAEFSALIKGQYPQYLALLEGLRSQSVSYHTLEEFLIGIGAKSSVLLNMEECYKYHDCLTESESGILIIEKENWGFLRIEITAEGDFLEVPKEVITTDEFLGRSYQLEYLIHPEKLHAGKNYGSIEVRTYYQTLRFEVEAVGVSEQKTELLGQQRQQRFWSQRQQRLQQQRQQKMRQQQLLLEYIDYRLGRLEHEAWLQKACEHFQRYRKDGGRSTFLKLYEAHIFFLQGREQEACSILEALESHKERLNTPLILGYYLYLTTFYNKEMEAILYVEENIGRLLRQEPKAWGLQWFLWNLSSGKNVNPSEKLEGYRGQLIHGCRSRILYLESFLLIKEDPLLLRQLGKFEIQVLRFINREKLWSDNVIIQVTELASRYKEYSRELYLILTGCYQFRESKELVHIICSLLMKGNLVGEEYFPWYERAVAGELRVTGLYEYYIQSVPDLRHKSLPPMIKRYFAYDNALDYRKKAQVYANIVRHKGVDESSYESYRAMSEKFVIDQLRAGRLNTDLAFLYETFLVRQMLNKEMALSLARALFTYEIRCSETVAKGVVIVHHQLKEEQRVRLSDGVAYMQLYTDDYQIFIEDNKGIRHAGGIPYTVTSVLKREQFLGTCQDLVPESVGLLLHQCNKDPLMKEENIKQFWELLKIEEVKESYKEQIRKNLLSYYYENQKEPFDVMRLSKIDYDNFMQADKQKLIELFITEGAYQQAYQSIAKYGAENIATMALVKLCSRMILMQGQDVDEMLLYLCYYCFAKGKYDEVILTYLLKHYDGPIDIMKQIWGAGKRFGLDTFVLEEKFLLMVIFTGVSPTGAEQVFADYRRRLGKKSLLTAYIIKRSYDFFIMGKSVELPVFRYIERGYQKGKIKQDICLLALLKWYGGQENLPEEQQATAMELLGIYICKNMCFAFYQELSSSMQNAFVLHDKSFIEYRTTPEAKVFLKYYKEVDGQNRMAEQREMMKHVYQGIFVSEFTLFYGERIIYTILVEENGIYKEHGSGVCESRGGFETEQNSRHEMLNEITKGQDNGFVQDYLEKACLSEKLFIVE